MVSDYPDQQEFFSYGEVVVWVGDAEHSVLTKLRKKNSLLDPMERVQEEIRKPRPFVRVELRSSHDGYPLVKPMRKDWNEGRTLKTSDTVYSSRLSEGYSIIMAMIALIDSQ